MEWIEVKSSHIRAIRYDENISKLEINFKDGSTYEYDDVPKYVYEELMAAESKGEYAHKNIYKNYKQRKI